MIQDKLDLLNTMQKKAVLKTEGPLLLLAGAGSGKTKVITHRIAYMIENGISPFNILAITFTNKAAKEMKERVTKVCEDGKYVWVSTFHSACVRILRSKIEKMGYDRNFTIYDSDDSEKLVKEIYKRFNINDKLLPIKRALSEIGKLKDELIMAKDFAKTTKDDFRMLKISEIYTEYEKMLKKNNALDFDDLIFKTVQLFIKFPEILNEYQEKFQYIMVDEYQDTNIAQYNLIKLLSAKYKNICVVGDDDQSIYGWRGANIKNIFNFEKDFKNVEIIKLEQNYRSTKIILNSANQVIKNNFGRKEKQLWTDNPTGERIKFFRATSDLEEAKFISSEVKRGIENNLKYSDFAVLYRNNSLSRIIEESFVKNSIPYKLFGGLSFYNRKEIKDIIGYLKVLFNPDDDIYLKRIINVPKRGIGDVTIDKISAFSQENNISLFDTIINISNINELKLRGLSKLNNFIELIYDLKQKADTIPVSELISEILAKTDYINQLKEDTKENVFSRIDNIQELINKAVEFENTSQDKSLQAFLSEISLVADIDNLSQDSNTVTLMTIHSSKGLEFPTVFIMGFEENIFPSYRSVIDSNKNSLEEERRLCYVGMTRAKKQLYITCSQNRPYSGMYMSNEISRFFREIPKQCVDVKSTMSFKNLDEFKTSKTNNSKKASNKRDVYISYYTLNNLKKTSDTAEKIDIDFEVGDKIKLTRYGIGKVEKITPMGNDYEVVVKFEKHGIKKIMAGLSKPKKIG